MKEDKKLDLSKPLQTRSGEKVRILMKDGGGEYPIIGAYYCPADKRWEEASWCPSGAYLQGVTEDALDLVNVPKKIVRYHNVYPDGEVTLGKTSRSMADSTASAGRIACIRVEYTEGQFDD